MAVTYSERLFVPIWWWPAVALLVLSLAVAVFAYAPWWVGTAVTVSLAAGLGVLLWSWGSVKIQVDGNVLRAGRSSIEGRWLETVEAFEGHAAREALGPGANHKDHMMTRPYAPGVVRVTLQDPADPHPHWILSSRRPAELANAIREMSQVA